MAVASDRGTDDGCFVGQSVLTAPLGNGGRWKREVGCKY
jgi:hypothetical protein